MAKVQLGSKHGRPAIEIVSTQTAHPKVDKDLAAKSGFFGTGDKPAFSWSRWVPFVVAGSNLSKEDAVKNFSTFIDSLDAVAKSDGVVVKGKDGEILADGPVEATPGRNSGESVGSYILRQIQYAYTLAHQNDMRNAHSDEIVKAASAKGVLKAEGTKSNGRTSRDARTI